MDSPTFQAEQAERGYTFLAESVRRRQTFPRQEVEAALQRYFAVAEASSASGDWNAWADLFTEDAIYIEHAYGIMRGREEVRAWVISATGAQPSDLHVTDEWHMIDNDLCVVYASNWKAAPDGGQPFGFNAVAILCYAGDGTWCYEEDLYNAVEAGAVLKAHAAARDAAA